MMRARDKLESYRVLADAALPLLAGFGRWAALIVGDGPARGEGHRGADGAMLGPRVAFAGALAA